MTTPVDEKDQAQYHTLEGARHPHQRQQTPQEKASDEEGTIIGDGSDRNLSPEAIRHRSNTHVTLDIPKQLDHPSLKSPSQTREQARRLDDDLAMLQVEQQVSQSQESAKSGGLGYSKSIQRSRSRREDPIDDFDAATNPLHEKTGVYKPPEHPNTSVGRIFKKIHGSSVLIRWFLYITPLTLIILVPLLLGALLFKSASVGGVKMDWFCIWLEIVWLSLWAGRVGSASLH
jgi:hypothetical protein